MSKRRRNNNSKILKSLLNKRRKQIESESKLINLDQTRKNEKRGYSKEFFKF